MGYWLKPWRWLVSPPAPRSDPGLALRLVVRQVGGVLQVLLAEAGTGEDPKLDDPRLRYFHHAGLKPFTGTHPAVMKTRLFNNVKVNKEPLSNSFRPEDAQRFVELVRARKRSLP